MIQELWNSHTLLFLGCGLKKDYLINHLIKLANSETNHWHYAIVELPKGVEAIRLRRRELTQLKIRPIWYEKGKHEQIIKILKMITGVNVPTIPMPTYFKQGIIDGDNIVTDEMDFMQNHRHIMIYGEGGLGKTTYLHELFQKARKSERFSFVFFASLPAIEKYGKNNKPQTFDDVTRFDEPENSFIFNYLFSQNEFDRSLYQTMISSCKSRNVKSVLLLLDDLNQLRDAMSGISDAIINEIECLSRNREYSRACSHKDCIKDHG